MKLMIVVVQRQDAGDLVDALTARSHRVTRISSEGGFLREGNVTLCAIFRRYLRWQSPVNFTHPPP